MTLLDTDPDAGLAPLQFQVMRNLQAKTDAEREAILANPGFGQHFTDHMVTIPYAGGAWGTPVVEAYAPLAIDPSAVVLHYAQTIFEGLKAYRHADSSIWTFRPEANAERMQRSARRLALPELPTDIFIESLKQLIALDKDWVPGSDETSLYLRPFMFGSEVFLGVRPA